MSTDDPLGVSRSEKPGNTGRRSFLWISSWALAFVFLGVVFVALTTHVVTWSSSDKFCGATCHSMTWVNAAYQRGPHYINNVGVRATCGDCHIPYDAGMPTQ